MATTKQTYLGNGNHSWETVATGHVAGKTVPITTARLRVPGGWLYLTLTTGFGYVYNSAQQTFVPLPKALSESREDLDGVKMPI